MAHAQEQGTFLGHPKGLYVLFFTEMWERFSYYGMRALLLLYMVNYFKMTQQDASGIYKWYTSLVYLTPLLGGFLADRYLGNKRAIIIGALLMSAGHFMMAFESRTIFYSALVFLIIGNGFFKPNMSTQVGRLYPTNDPRRDSAYTIFYMGINLGAFLSPLVCDWLRVNTSWSYHAGFTAAGVGMVLGLVTYLVFIKWVEEVPESITYEGNSHEDTTEEPEAHYMTEAEAATTPSVFPTISRLSPVALVILGVLCAVSAVVLAIGGVIKLDNAVALGVGGGLSCAMGWYILKHVSAAVRDRVLAIYVVAVFVVFFWAAFEQAGNAMTIYADKTTNRYLTETPPAPPIYPVSPDAAAGDGAGGFMRNLNPVPTGWFQSINALAIFTLAPLFAWLWVALPKRGIHLSIPAKVAIGVFMQGAAFSLMIWSVTYENGPSSTALAELPPGLTTQDNGTVVFRDAPDLGDDKAFEAYSDAEAPSPEHAEVVHGGRITYDPAEKRLDMTGALADTDRDRLLRATTPKSFLQSVQALAKQSTDAKATGDTWEVSVVLDATPPGFDIRYAGFAEDKLRYDADTRTLTTTAELQDKDYKAVLLTGANPTFRDALNILYVESAKYKVSSAWLFWFYILCTIGELCLSPVGLSMVSKLAPAKFATMLMGMWLLTNFFGNFLAGFAGETWGTVHPTVYFTFITIALVAASGVAFASVKIITAMMHGVK